MYTIIQHRSRVLLIVLAIVVGAALVSAAYAETRAAMIYADVFGLEWVSDPQISPDGRWIIYVRRGMDVRSDRVRGTLWLMATDGSTHRPLSNNANEGALPRWSPDGRRVAWIARDGDSGAQLFVHWLDSGTSGAITRLPEAPRSLVWSPDGRLLAFTMPVPASRKAFKVELPKAPEGVKWAEPPKVIDRMVYRADGEGYLPDTFSHLFVIAARAARRAS